MNQTPLTCDFEGPKYLLFNEGISLLVYSSHIPIFIFSFLLGIFVLSLGWRKIPHRVFYFTMIAFGGWIFLDSIYWATNRPDVIVFVWSTVVLLEPLVHIGMLYLVFLFITRRDVSFKIKLVLAALFLPQLIFSLMAIDGFNLTECAPDETIFAYYSYVIEVIIILWIIVYAFMNLKKMLHDERLKGVIYVIFGILFFLISFTGGNLYGSRTGDWNIAAIGYFGLIILASFVAYSIVKYQVFSAKVIGAQMLMVLLWVLVGSQFVFASTDTQKILVIVAFLISVIFGYFLIRSVSAEIKRKEELQVLAKKLESANVELTKLDKAKSEFISIASHQLRTPLTAIKGYISLITEGSYGQISPEVGGALTKIYKSNERIIQLVEDLLNISRIESGRMQYNFKQLNISEVVLELNDTFINRAKDESLEFTIKTPEEPMMVSADSLKIREVISNVIDNAIKYTEKGFIHVDVTRSGENVRIMVSDSGIGIPPEIIPQLFAKFSRGKDQSRLHVDGTGLGLYVGRSIIEAHHGRIIVTSDGVGKGSQFTIEMPLSTRQTYTA